jgi:hypothetical protein
VERSAHCSSSGGKEKHTHRTAYLRRRAPKYQISVLPVWLRNYFFIRIDYFVLLFFYLFSLFLIHSRSPQKVGKESKLDHAFRRNVQ